MQSQGTHDRVASETPQKNDPRARTMHPAARAYQTAGALNNRIGTASCGGGSCAWGVALVLVLRGCTSIHLGPAGPSRRRLVICHSGLPRKKEKNPPAIR